MVKAFSRTSYSCSECSYKTLKWLGACPECQNYGTITLDQPLAAGKKNYNQTASLLSFNDIKEPSSSRIFSGIAQWDLTVGGGLVVGSITILTGEPGVGKSTLLLTVADKIAEQNSIVYFSTEETAFQIKSRAIRLGLGDSKLSISQERDFNSIVATLLQVKPEVAIIDSIQGCVKSSPDGFFNNNFQIKEMVLELVQICKDNDIALVLTGHIIKDGTIAGPKLIEHMVDTVLYFQGDDNWGCRVLSATKNRFGNTGQVGFFSMEEDAIVQIQDINQRTIESCSPSFGQVFGIFCASNRPIIVEFQALCVKSKFGMPQRVATGIDQKRLILVCAILEKYLKIDFGSIDIFFKISGGLLFKESTCDLAIAIAILSSYMQKSVDQKSAAIGEIGLTGKVSLSGKHKGLVQQAISIGLCKVFVGNLGTEEFDQKSSAKVLEIKTIYDLVKLFN